jgi:uncharacterized protein (DUF885 family)
MKVSLKTVVALVLVALAALAIWWIVRLIWLRPSDIDMFYSRSFYDLYDEDPEYLSLVAPPIAGRISTYPSSLNNPLPERTRSQRRKAAKLLQQLEGYSQAKLNVEQQQTYAFLGALLKNMALGEPFSEREFLFMPHSGLHSRLPAFLTYVPVINNREEATAFLERVRALPVLINMAL